MAPSRKANFMKKIFNDDKQTKLSSFSKRNPTLKKKAFELQTLCDVSVSFVCYGPNGSVDFWPEEKTELTAAIMSYKESEKKQKQEINVLKFLEAKKNKLMKRKTQVRKKKIDQVIENCSKIVDELSGDSLMKMMNFLENKLMGFKEKLKCLKINGEEAGQVSLDLTDSCDRNKNLLEAMVYESGKNPLVSVDSSFNSIVGIEDQNMEKQIDSFEFGAMESNNCGLKFGVPENFDIMSRDFNVDGAEIIKNTNFAEDNYWPLEVQTNFVESNYWPLNIQTSSYPMDSIYNDLVMDENWAQNNSENWKMTQFNSNFLNGISETNNNSDMVEVNNSSWLGFLEGNNIMMINKNPNPKENFGKMGLREISGDDQEMLFNDVLPISKWNGDSLIRF